MGEPTAVAEGDRLACKPCRTGYAVLGGPGSLAILVTGWSGQGCTTSPSVPKEEDAFLGMVSESDEFVARPVLT